jgi:hypothetical protein
MRAFYSWSMRHGSHILFALSAVLFLIGFGQALVSLQNTVGESYIAGERVSEGALQWVMFMTGALTALSTAVFPFIGALVIHRWDRATLARDVAPRPEENVG